MKHHFAHSFSLIVIMLLVGSCNPEASTEKSSENSAESTAKNATTIVFSDISVSAAQILLEQQQAVILDVRTPEEYNVGHIEGAINININGDNFSEEVNKLNHEQTYIVHCAANVENGRTAKSVAIMKELGFENLQNLVGGIVEWQANSLPVVKAEILE